MSSTGRLLSFGKATDYSSMKGTQLSQKAVDGRAMIDVPPPASNETSAVDFAFSETCFQSGGVENEPWWSVDLGSVFHITGIHFYGKITDIGIMSL